MRPAKNLAITMLCLQIFRLPHGYATGFWGVPLPSRVRQRPGARHRPRHPARCCWCFFLIIRTLPESSFSTIAASKLAVSNARESSATANGPSWA